MAPRKPRPRSSPAPRPVQVALVAVPEGFASTIFGLYDVLNAGTLLGPRPEGPPAPSAFHARIVGEARGPVAGASRIPVEVQEVVKDAPAFDVVIVPALWVGREGWRRGRHPRLVEWLRAAHERGAVLCSACSGLFVLAETGLWDGRDATVHYDYARTFSAAFPAVTIHPERVLVLSGPREDLVSSGASTSWHDLALYLVARYAGAAAAQEAARMFALQWHVDGLRPYIAFEGRTDHGDAEVLAAQRWLDAHFAGAHPVQEAIRRSPLAERTFKRRFAAATGLTPIEYVQRLRIEDAKRRLERTDAPVEQVGWRVGYGDPAFFRRLFKRTTGLAPGAYRRRFRLPDFARH